MNLRLSGAKALPEDHVGMRISVSSWATTERDVERSLGAIVRMAAESSP